MKRGLFAALGAVGMVFAANGASADIIKYKVSSTPVVNCAGAPHGLWTRNYIGGGGCSNYFDVQDGSFFELDTDTNTARLYGTAENPNNPAATATFDIYLDGYLDSIQGTTLTYKKEGGPAYNVALDDPNIDFFTALQPNTVSTIIFSGTPGQDGTYFLNPSDPFTGSTTFQFGRDLEGANAKNQDLGASAWINVQDAAGNDVAKNNSHWDFNLNFEKVTVSEPEMIALFGFGLIGLYAARRRKS
ncbi:MAG: PEP-CTERM sorting domain-containing protein [Pseudomonadota bacterium]